MSREISEHKFEDDIEYALASGDGASIVSDTAVPYGFGAPGGYQLRNWKTDYDRERCLIPRDVFDFLYATQPREWQKYETQYGADAKEKFLQRLTGEIKKRGTLDVLRRGVKDVGCHFRLVYFPPVSSLNEDLARLCDCNVFSVVRQLHYSTGSEQSLDLGIFVNGLPVFTAELKSPLNGQDVQDAVKQYRFDRDPKEPLFVRGRCLAHFAVDPELVMVTTELAGARTRFLPFNRGSFGGAGNPPISPAQASEGRYASYYLWDEIWARRSVLNLLQHFIHEIELENDKGKKTGRKQLIFPRYHQLDSVRGLIAHAFEHGPGQRYLIEHSAGSGKSNSIAWLAHQLSSLHDAKNESVFDSVVVVTDRRVLDRQLQRTIRQFEQTSGTVENVDQTSRQLKEALEDGKKIIVTTLQKFSVISEQMVALPGKNFAVIVDEAHSSQSGESAKHLKETLSASGLAEATSADEEDVEALEDRILEEIRKRGPQPHMSHFAFTATPKPKTLELFGSPRSDGKFEAFSVYSMRQAIEEGFILDVLENYTTYKTYFRLLKKIEDDPKYDKSKANYLLKSFVDLHEHSIEKKVTIIAEHFHEQVASAVDGRAKAMVVTRSRLHAVRYGLALRKYLKEKGYPYEAVVAFSGTVKDGGADYTESNLNGVSENQTVATFAKAENRFLVVANKFQTGFDQPLLTAMYVDKQLRGVNAVQTLSRLNRTAPRKTDTFVLDFSNESDSIRDSFQPYYETTLLSEATDPNQLYDLERQLMDFGVFDAGEIEAFAKEFFVPKVEQSVLYALLAPNLQRFEGLTQEEQEDFRQKLGEFGRLYAFLSQVVTFADTSLEKLHAIARTLRRLLPVTREELPREIREKIDLESLRIGETSAGQITLERGSGTIEPTKGTPGGGHIVTEEEALSRIIDDLNDRFGLECTPEDRLTIERVFTDLVRDGSLDAAVRANTRENALLTFEHKFKDRWQEIIDSNFKLYRRTTDEPPIFRALLEQLFDRLALGKRDVEQVIKEGESQTVEFKSTLRRPLEGEGDGELEKKLNLACLKTAAAFLNTAGGDLLIGVDDDGRVLGLYADGFESDDKYVRHVSQLVANALGDTAATFVDPQIKVVNGKKVCMVSCSRSNAGAFLKWKKMNKREDGDFFVRQGALTKRLPDGEIESYLAGR
jgi:type I restriction enzyme R subunit